MPGLMRSKSMRLLKGSLKDTAPQEHAQSVPLSDHSQTNNDRDLSATPISRAEEKPETSDMLLRPSTSAGPGDRRPQFHLKTYPVPTVRSQQDLTFSALAKSTTTLYAAEVTESRKGVIGIALGSPTVGAHWTTSPEAASFSADVHGAQDQMSTFGGSVDSSSTTVNHQSKPKLSRWRSMFRKAGPPPPPRSKSPFYQLAKGPTTTRAARADSHQDTDSVEARGTSRKESDTGRTQSPSCHKADIRASRITPRTRPAARARAFTAATLPANPRASIQRSATTPYATASIRIFDQTPASQPTRTNTVRGITMSDGRPQLDIDVPDITMERYSVMFGNVLQSASSRTQTTSNRTQTTASRTLAIGAQTQMTPIRNQATPARTPSLLARRQGNADTLKPLKKIAVKEEIQESPMDYRLQRRATSPRISSPSPRLSLFPNANNSRAPSPLSTSTSTTRKTRSKTAPEKSPLRQIFSRNEQQIAKGREIFLQKGPANTIAESGPSKLQQPAITPNSAVSIESEAESVTIVVAHASPGHPQTIRLDDREPEWEICQKQKSLPVPIPQLETPSVSSLARTPSQQRNLEITKASALRSHPSSAPLDVASPLQRMASLRSPPSSARQVHEMKKDDGNVQSGAGKAMLGVGVARSVSVSRAHSPRTLVRTATDLSSPSERFVEKATLTPTMVEVRNRKSQRVTLEDA